MTSNKEDYLKAIYELGGLEGFISNKQLANKLDISPASVSEMLGKLEKQGLIDYKAYSGAALTKEGAEVCIDVIYSHEIWEVFLMKHLGYTWREAHEDAHFLEHTVPKRMIERLDAFLDYPVTCPHGSPIPREGRIPPARWGYIHLSSLNKGENATVMQVEEDGRLLDYLSEAGLRIGEDILVLDIEAYDGPVVCRQGEKTIRISHRAALQIYVKREEGGGENEDR